MYDDDFEWTACTASVTPGISLPFKLNLSSEYHGDLSYVITPVRKTSYVFTDIFEERSCLFSPCGSADDIADEIDSVIEDEDLSALIAYALVSLCLPRTV